MDTKICNNIKSALRYKICIYIIMSLVVPRPTGVRQQSIGTGQGHLPAPGGDNAAAAAAFQDSAFSGAGLSRQDSLGESLGRHDDMQQLSDEDAKETEAGFKEVQQYLAAQRAEKQRKEKKKKKGKTKSKTKSKKLNGGRKRRRKTKRRRRKKRKTRRKRRRRRKTRRR